MNDKLFKSSDFTIRDSWNNGSNHRVYHAWHHDTENEYMLVDSSEPRLLDKYGRPFVSAVNDSIIEAIRGAAKAARLTRATQ